MSGAVAHVYATPDGALLCVPLARLPGEGPFVEVAPVEQGDELDAALERALARSAELSGAAQLPRWDGAGVRDASRLLARLKDVGGGAYDYVPQERLEDEYGASWTDGATEELAGIDAVAERLRADADAA